MNREFLEMLYLYSCGIWNKTPETEEKISDDVFRYAVEQGVYPFVYLGIENLGTKRASLVSDKVYNYIKQNTFKSIGNSVRRLNISHKLMEEFEKEGIKCCVLKGESLSYLYSNSSCRISGDIDLLIEKKDLKKISQILADKGFSLEPLFPTSHHLVAYHPTGGEFELHFELYDLQVTESMFSEYAKVNEDFMDVTVDGCKIKTLGINDGFLFTFLHYVKHFLSGGTGIKPLTDVLMYAVYYKNKIDWENFYKIIGELHYDKLFDVSLTIGTEYLQFNADKLPVFDRNIELANEVLDDIRCGGNFGKCNADRKHFAYVVMSQRGKEGENKYNAKRLVRVIFPKKETFKRKYPEIKKGIFFYSRAWLRRAFSFFKKRGDIGTVKKIINPYKELELNETNMKRLKLLGNLNIIDKL